MSVFNSIFVVQWLQYALLCSAVHRVRCAILCNWVFSCMQLSTIQCASVCNSVYAVQWWFEHTAQHSAVSEHTCQLVSKPPAGSPATSIFLLDSCYCDRDFFAWFVLLWRGHDRFSSEINLKGGLASELPGGSQATSIWRCNCNTAAAAVVRAFQVSNALLSSEPACWMQVTERMEISSKLAKAAERDLGTSEAELGGKWNCPNNLRKNSSSARWDGEQIVPVQCQRRRGWLGRVAKTNSQSSDMRYLSPIWNYQWLTRWLTGGRC